jgi:CheY-like chemotaxis protein
MLEKAKCDVVLASNGKEALDILYDESCEKYVGYHNFNLILMDCQMPVIDGYQATLSIREWETSQYGAPHMRVIALTASSCAENEKQCYLAGMDSFIAKPVTYQALTSRIASEQICGSPVGEYSL